MVDKYSDQIKSRQVLNIFLADISVGCLIVVVFFAS